MNDAEAFALTMGILFFAAAFFYLAYVFALRFFGKKTEGEFCGREIKNDIPYEMSPFLVSFSDERGKRHTEKYKLGTYIKPYKMGQKFTVYYFPKDTSRFIVWDISLIHVFLMAAAGGAVFLFLAFR